MFIYVTNVLHSGFKCKLSIALSAIQYMIYFYLSLMFRNV